MAKIWVPFFSFSFSFLIIKYGSLSRAIMRFSLSISLSLSVYEKNSFKRKDRFQEFLVCMDDVVGYLPLDFHLPYVYLPKNTWKRKRIKLELYRSPYPYPSPKVGYLPLDFHLPTCIYPKTRGKRSVSKSRSPILVRLLRALTTVIFFFFLNLENKIFFYFHIQIHSKIISLIFFYIN
jgi:hypothetical protein